MRKADSSFDEDLIEKLLSDAEVSARQAGQAQYLYDKSPAFRKAYLTALKETGHALTAAEEGEISQAALAEKKDEAPQYTEKQIRDWIDKTATEMETGFDHNGNPVAKHTALAIMRWIQAQEKKWIDDPAREKAAKAEETRRNAEQKARHDEQASAHFRAQGSEVLAAYPKLFKAEPRAPYGVVCIDKVVWDEILDQGGVKSMKDACTKALKILGRHTSNTQTTQQRAAVSAPRTNNLAPNTNANKTAPEPGMARITFKTRTAPPRR